MMPIKSLSSKELYRACDTSLFDFKTTAELDDLNEVIGQARALEAIQFGIGIKKNGYNLFALGPAGTGKHGVVTQLLAQKAASEPDPMDLCYVNNFEQSHKPNKLFLPKGKGVLLRQDMEKLVDELGTVIPAVFESDDYRSRVQKLDDELKEKQENAIDGLRKVALEKHIALIRTPNGFAFAPMRGEEVLNPKEFKKLPDGEKARVEQEVDSMQDELQRILNMIPQWRREAREKLKTLNRDIVTPVVAHLIDELRHRYEDQEDVLSYFDAVQDDVIGNVDDFRRDKEEEASIISFTPHTPIFRRYEINVLVDHSITYGAPVVYEDNPTFQNLVGRVEHLAMMGALVTDFTLIKPGALHRANNGYLILEAYKVLQHPFSWESLKRALRSNEIRIGSLEQMLSMVSTVSLEPEPVRLNLKVVLVGDRILYYLLYQLDPEFKELFKVAADFEDQMDRTPENNHLYARMIATLAKKEGLRPFDISGVARVIEQSARLSSDSDKLTAHMRSICDLLCEADYWAGQHGRDVIIREDVQTAVNAQIRRSSRMKERLHESIHKNILFIDTDGETVGQVNGLTVIELGNVSFGSPTRITAQVRMGDGEVIDIEREVELGGPIHSKGVMILSGFLGARYASKTPLALSASLVFEQSYGEIEGDSASSAELYALLSALSGIPIKQNFAVTGSVNQLGQIQAIGGVNEKIEGFFDVCKKRGLNGEHAVLIPSSNINDLMLCDEVTQAVEQGKFNVYAVSTIDEGIEILTNHVAGEVDEDGEFPEESINGKVAHRLLRFAEIRHEFGDHKKDHDPEAGDGK